MRTNVIKTVVFSIVILFGFYADVYSSGFQSTNIFRVNHGTTEFIVDLPVGSRAVTNTCGFDIMVPTRTSPNDRQAFLNHAGITPCITLNQCSLNSHCSQTVFCSNNNYYGITGTQGPTTTSQCVLYQYSDLTQICSNGNCVNPSCGSPSSSVQLSAGTCRFINGCTGSTPGTIGFHPFGTGCGSGRVCDGSGGCIFTYSWNWGSWGSCQGGNCGTGTQTRSVWCERSDGATVSDSFCGGGKPATSQGCNLGTCPSGQECSSNICVSLCGNGIINPGEECDEGSNNAAGVFGAGNAWSRTCTADCRIPASCSFTIGDGSSHTLTHQTGTNFWPQNVAPGECWSTNIYVACNNGQLTSSLTGAFRDSCPSYLWHEGSWGPCEGGTCGTGTQTRTVTCRRDDGVTVSDSFCTGTRPSEVRECNLGTCSAGEVCSGNICIPSGGMSPCGPLPGSSCPSGTDWTCNAGCGTWYCGPPWQTPC